jgi:hypothetical protein
MTGEPRCYLLSIEVTAFEVMARRPGMTIQV